MSSKQNIFLLWKNLFAVMIVIIILSIVVINIMISGMGSSFEADYLKIRNDSIYRLIKSTSMDALIIQDKIELRFILKDLVEQNPHLMEIMVTGLGDQALTLVTNRQDYDHQSIFTRDIVYSKELLGSVTVRWNATEELGQIHLYQLKMRIFYSGLVLVAVGLVVFFAFRKAFKTCSEFVEVDYLSKHDSLTGLANRRELERYMEEEVERVSKGGISFAVILFDVDYFKLFNDTLGHQAGDECLQRVAEALQRLTHRHSDLAARFGGEEFIVVLTDIIGDGKELAQRYLSAVHELNIRHQASLVDDYVTLSAGVSICNPTSGLSFRELIKQADDALYAAKRLGRNRVISFREYEKGLYIPEEEQELVEKSTVVNCKPESESYELPQYAAQPMS